MDNKKPKLLFWDIESTDLRADWGEMLCFGYMFEGDRKPTIISVLDDPKFGKQLLSDKWLVHESVKILSQADAWVTHYGQRFDAPFVNTRALIHGVPTLPPTAHIDTWRIARDNLKLQSNRLANITDILHLHSKTPVAKDAWRLARKGDKKSLKYVIDHCYHDVIALKQTYEKLRPLINNHPAIHKIYGKIEVCQGCGNSLEKAGVRATKTTVYQRYRCNGCGMYSQKPIKINQS